MRAIRVPVAAVLAVLVVCVIPEAAGALPSGWGYELVSPEVTTGFGIDFGAGSADGDHAWVGVILPLTPDAGTGNLSSLAETRTASGWVESDEADPSAPGNDTFILEARSEDSSHVIVMRCPETLIACDKYVRFERVGADGSRTVMLEDSPFTFGDGNPSVVGASADLSSIYVSLPQGEPPLLPADTHTQGNGLYVSHEGQVEYVGYGEHGEVLPCGAVLSTGGRGTGFEQNGLSADGLTAVFESPDPEAGCPEPEDVYVRRGGHSVDVSAPTNGNPDEGARYLGSSRDGNTVYFLTASQLLPPDTEGVADIYAYDVPSATLTRITTGAEVRAAAVSPNGDYVYFRAFAPIDGHGTEGLPNLYLYHAGAIRYIATANSGSFILGGAVGRDTVSPITPDGTHLLFRSNADLTGQPVGETFQLFQYDATHNSIVCISCHPDGTEPTHEAVSIGAAPNGNVDQRFQSDDGRTVVFDTQDALVPQDTNGVSDVYMWHEGVISLVSSGQSLSESKLVSIDAAGHNVFFESFERLAPGVEQDTRKLYDARLGGGFPPAPLPVGCTGDECQGGANAPVSLGSPGSALVSGAGNLAAVPSAPAVKRKPVTKRKAKKKKRRKKRRAVGHSRTRSGKTARGLAVKGSVRVSGGRGR